MLAINYIRTLIAFVVAQVNTHLLLHCLNAQTARVSRSEVLILTTGISSSSLTSLIFNLAVNFHYGCSI